MGHEARMTKSDHAKRREILDKLRRQVEHACQYPMTDPCWMDVGPEELAKYKAKYGEFDVIVGDFRILEIK